MHLVAMMSRDVVSLSTILPFNYNKNLLVGAVGNVINVFRIG